MDSSRMIIVARNCKQLAARKLTAKSYDERQFAAIPVWDGVDLTGMGAEWGQTSMGLNG